MNFLASVGDCCNQDPTANMVIGTFARAHSFKIAELIVSSPAPWKVSAIDEDFLEPCCKSPEIAFAGKVEARVNRAPEIMERLVIGVSEPFMPKRLLR